VIGVAVALRERTAATLALAAASAVGMVAATITEPQLEDQDTSQWWDKLVDGDLQFTLAGAAAVLLVWGVVAAVAGDAPGLTLTGVVAGAAAAVWATVRRAEPAAVPAPAQ
jgi:hypothetical protein